MSADGAMVGPRCDPRKAPSSQGGKVVTSDVAHVCATRVPHVVGFQTAARALLEGVNFFGHAAVASWTSQQPGVLLGAMLPDFAGMCGGRVEAVDDEVICGVALHHATDAVFHQLPVVTELMRELDARLDERRCGRGPRRAVAHIGVELLLDGALTREPVYRAAYLAGLEHDAVLRWRAPDEAPRFAILVERLRAGGVPDDLRRPAAITARVHRILAHRPLLAPSPDDLRAIGDALAGFQPRVEVAAETIVRAMRAALVDRPLPA
jgi:acyl carrier protein phosphodiesterase